MIIIVPVIVIAFIVLGVIAVGAQIVDINIMPVFSFISFMFVVFGIITIFKSRKEEDLEISEKMNKIGIGLTVVSAIIFVITLCSSLTIGDAISWIWYHI